jgi:hypothetical protein
VKLCTVVLYSFSNKSRRVATEKIVAHKKCDYFQEDSFYRDMHDDLNVRAPILLMEKSREH